MANVVGTILGGAQIVLGGLISLIPGGAIFGVPLIISGTVSIAGSLIAPRPTGGLGGFSSSATYGFDNLSNAAFEGAPQFFVLGSARIAPTYISVGTEQVSGSEYLNLLTYCGSGGDYGIASIGNIEINGQSIEHFSDVTVSKRYGTSSQTAIKGFEKASTPYSQNYFFQYGTQTWTYQCNNSVDEVAIVLKWQKGAYRLRSDGDVDRVLWGALVQYSTDGNNWTTYACDGSGGFSTDSNGGWNIYLKSTSAVTRTIKLTWTSKAKYYLKIWVPSYVFDNPPKVIRSPTVIRVEERYDADRKYAGSALLAMRIKATSQLSGNLPKITCVVDGWKVMPLKGNPVAAFNRNPAALVRAVLVNDEDGCGSWFSNDDLDIAASGTWQTAADYYNENAASSGDHKEARHEVDLVVDSIQSAEEWVNHMLFLCRGSLVEHGGKVRFLIDKSASSDRTFDARQTRAAGTRGILRDENGKPTLAVHEIESDKRTTHVRAQYFDKKDNTYERRWTEQIVSPEWSTGDPIVTQELYLPGIRRQTEAMRMARYSLNKARLRTLMVEFEASIDSIDLLPMDVISISADYPAWTAKTFQVLGVAMTIDGHCRIVAWEYDSDVYTDTSDTLPGVDEFLSRSAALLKAGKIPRGANSVSAKVRV